MTPEMPKALKSASVSAGVGALPAAVSKMACARTAKASILATESTALVVCAPMTVLSSDWAAEPLAKLAAVLAPMAL